MTSRHIYAKRWNNKINTVAVFLQKIQPQNFFLTVALFFGVLYVLINPMFLAPDEHAHFYRVADISNGHLTAKVEGGVVGARVQPGVAELFEHYPYPKELSNKNYKYKINELLSIEPGGYREKFLKVSTTLYTPISYTPQIAVYSLGSMIKLNPFILFLLVRLAGLLAGIGLTYFAIKIIPRGKWLLAVLALLPMSLFISSSVSSDTITNGLVFLLVAMVFNAITKPGALTRKYLLILSVVALALALSKPSFFLASILLFALPTPKFINKNKFIILKVSLFVVAILLTAFWQTYVSKLASMITFPGANIMEQISFITSKPLQAITALWNTALVPKYSDIIYVSFIGSLGLFNINLPLWLVGSWLIALVNSAGVAANKTKDSLKKWHKLLFITAAFSLLSALLLGLYLTWTAPGSSYIAGIQGRYLLPIFAILIPVIASNRHEPGLRTRLFIVIGVVLLEIFSLGWYALWLLRA